MIQTQIFLKILKIFWMLQNLKNLYHAFLGDTKFEIFVSRLFGLIQMIEISFWALGSSTIWVYRGSRHAAPSSYEQSLKTFRPGLGAQFQNRSKAP